MRYFRHARLARHAGVWRVDGIGPIEDRGGQLGLRAVVHFSGLSDTGIRDPYNKRPTNGKSLRLAVHSASLCHFRVGTLWQDGKRIYGAQPVRESFLIDAGRVRLVKLNESVDLNGVAIPTVVPDNYLRFEHANRKNLAPTLYAIAPVLANSRIKWLVVPTTELVRFYIGVSSRFMSSSLRGRFDNYIDWDRSRIENGTAILHIQQRISRKEAMVLSRSIASPRAKAALLGVHQHLAATHSNNAALSLSMKHPLIIEANFPFNDTTELQIAGKRILLTHEGGREQWAIFAMEILTCSHPPGFEDVILEGGDPSEFQMPQEGSGKGTPPPAYHPLFLEDEDHYAIDEVPADARLPRLVLLSFTDQFTGFRGLRFEHRRPNIGRPGGEQRSNIDVPVNTLTGEDGSHSEDSKGNLGTSEFQSKVGHVNDRLNLFLDMIKFFRVAAKSKGWTVSTRKLRDGLPRDEEWVALFPINVGKRRRWHLISVSEKKVRPRQVVWVEISTKGNHQHFNLLEMELKPDERSTQCTILMHTNNFTALDDKTFDEWLALTAIRNRWPDPNNKWANNTDKERAQEIFKTVKIYRIHHPYMPKKTKGTVNPEAWSKYLLEEIKNLFPQF